MDGGEYQKIILARPPCQAWGVEPTEKKVAVTASIQTIVNKVITRFDFDFAESSAIETAVEDVQTYTLKGDSDVRNIKRLKYGLRAIVLDQYTDIEHDEFMSNRESTTTSPHHWYVSGISNSFPDVTIVGTVTAGDDILYSYSMKNLAINRFPDEWSTVIILGVENDLFGAAGMVSSEKNFRTADPILFNERFETEVARMIDNYERRRGQEAPIPMQKSWKAKNRRRDRLHGY